MDKKKIFNNLGMKKIFFKVLRTQIKYFQYWMKYEFFNSLGAKNEVLKV